MFSLLLQTEHSQQFYGCVNQQKSLYFKVFFSSANARKKQCNLSKAKALNVFRDVYQGEKNALSILKLFWVAPQFFEI